MNKNGEIDSLKQAEIEKLRAIWEKELNKPEPKAAIDLLSGERSFRSNKETA
jgi:hypothetical protein